jgi:hypothetical protein
MRVNNADGASQVSLLRPGVFNNASRSPITLKKLSLSRRSMVSFRHYATGFEGTVEIEPNWTAFRREQAALISQISKSRPGHTVNISSRSKPTL